MTEKGEGSAAELWAVMGGIIMVFSTASWLFRDPIALQTICPILPSIASIWEMVAGNKSTIISYTSTSTWHHAFHPLHYIRKILFLGLHYCEGTPPDKARTSII